MSHCELCVIKLPRCYVTIIAGPKNACLQSLQANQKPTGQTNSSDTRSFSQSSHCSIFTLHHQAADSECYKRKVALEMLLGRLEPKLSTAELVFVVLSPDSLRSGQRRGHPLQHHRSRRRSAPEWDLQHRPNQWQHVCHPTPRQRGESLLPCKKDICVYLLPL